MTCTPQSTRPALELLSTALALHEALGDQANCATGHQAFRTVLAEHLDPVSVADVINVLPDPDDT